MRVKNPTCKNNTGLTLFSWTQLARYTYSHACEKRVSSQDRMKTLSYPQNAYTKLPEWE